MHTLASRPSSVSGAVIRGEQRKVMPLRLAHTLFFAQDIEKSIELYCDVLRLRVLGYPGSVAFLHGAHGSDHRPIAFVQSMDVGCHHSAWDVESFEELDLGASQMFEAGYKRGWGLGRHALGSNDFNYICDPWESYAEYSYDIDCVPAQQYLLTGYPAPENSLYL